MTLRKLLLWESEYMMEPIPLSAREEDEEGQKMKKHSETHFSVKHTHTPVKLTCHRGSVAAHLGQVGMLVCLGFLRLYRTSGLTHGGHCAKGHLGLRGLSRATLHRCGHCALSSPLYQRHSVSDGLPNDLCITLMKET